MVIDFKMCRFENEPWGFRLVGGSDFEIPLTVVMVKEGSLAEKAGMRIGDVVVRINEDATSPLTHNEAHTVISNCGNQFFIGVYREEDDEVADFQEQEAPIEYLQCITPESARKSPMSDLSEKPYELAMEKTSGHEDTEEINEAQAEEEEIAAVMSGEAEILKEHNVIGVNFNRIFPKPGVCMSSEVLKELNKEAIKTKLEKDKEKKKWTTFLQKPDRPIPKSKQQLEAEAKAAAAYKVKIVIPSKQPDPPKPPTPEPEPEPEVIEEQVPEEPEEEPPTDTEVPNLEENLGTVPIEELEDINNNGYDEIQDFEEIEVASQPEEELSEVQEEAKIVPEIVTEIVTEKTEEEMVLEKQLAEVQRQLLALSSLPSTIQATLDSVTKQLAELLPTFKLQNGISKELAVPTPTPNTEEERIEAQEDINELDVCEETENYKPSEEDTENEPIIVSEKTESLVSKTPEPVGQIEDDIETQDQGCKLSDELDYKKQKENDVIDELEKHIKREKTKSKGSKRLFGPLVPQQRPQCLPGGRKWYRPKDAYNEEFIAETLSAQAELIIGSTLGVNFMKYQKPEKKIDLGKSEVYKVVHHLSKDPIRGIEIRPPVVPSAEDIRNTAAPISCG